MVEYEKLKSADGTNPTFSNLFKRLAKEIPHFQPIQNSGSHFYSFQNGVQQSVVTGNQQIQTPHSFKTMNKTKTYSFNKTFEPIQSQSTFQPMTSVQSTFQPMTSVQSTFQPIETSVETKPTSVVGMVMMPDLIIQR